MTPSTVVEIPTITRKELLELKEAENALAEASKTKNAAEARVKPLRMLLAEKALGVKTEDEYRALDQEGIAALIEERKGLFDLVRGAPGFAFKETANGRYVAWKEEFIKALGQAAADKVTAETPTTYSYRVVVE